MLQMFNLLIATTLLISQIKSREHFHCLNFESLVFICHKRALSFHQQRFLISQVKSKEYFLLLTKHQFLILLIIGNLNLSVRVSAFYRRTELVNSLVYYLLKTKSNFVFQLSMLDEALSSKLGFESVNNYQATVDRQ